MSFPGVRDEIWLTDLLNRGEKINLPAIMISHIGRVANTSKDHDMGYGLLLTFVFEQLGIPLQKRVSLQITGEIGGSTLIRCSFHVKNGGSASSE